MLTDVRTSSLQKNLFIRVQARGKFAHTLSLQQTSVLATSSMKCLLTQSMSCQGRCQLVPIVLMGFLCWGMSLPSSRC